MKSKTLTKAQAEKFAKLYAKRDEAVTDIFANGPNNVTPFLECFKLSPTMTQKRYEDAIDALREFEQKMVDERRGYRNTFGSFCQYY